MDVVRSILALDVGATKTAAALVVPATGAVDALETIETRTARGGAAVLEDCVSLAERVADGTRPDAVAIGICELVDLEGAITSEDSVSWRGLDLHAAFAHLGPLHVESDVRAAATAEARFGAARGRRSCLYVNVGSGVSSCFLLDGVPVSGERGNAILLGAGPLDVEAEASGKAIARRFGVATALEVSDAALAGDGQAREILRDAGAAVGEAVGFAVNLLDPAAVVLGGGVALHAAFFSHELERTLREQIGAETTRGIPVVPAELGAEGGVIGAALAAASRVPAGAL
jgi:glucokinase